MRWRSRYPTPGLTGLPAQGWTRHRPRRKGQGSFLLDRGASCERRARNEHQAKKKTVCALHDTQHDPSRRRDKVGDRLTLKPFLIAHLPSIEFHVEQELRQQIDAVPVEVGCEESCWVNLTPALSVVVWSGVQLRLPLPAQMRSCPAWIIREDRRLHGIDALRRPAKIGG